MKYHNARALRFHFSSYWTHTRSPHTRVVACLAYIDDAERADSLGTRPPLFAFSALHEAPCQLHEASWERRPITHQQTVSAVPLQVSLWLWHQYIIFLLYWIHAAWFYPITSSLHNQVISPPDWTGQTFHVIRCILISFETSFAAASCYGWLHPLHTCLLIWLADHT